MRNLNEFILTLILGITIQNLLSSQSIVKDYPFPTPSIDESHHQLKVYLPSGYKSSENKKYNVVIYLHGSSGNNFNSIGNVIKTTADLLINVGIIKPLVIIMPNLQTNISPSFGNRHLYENSEYFGKYGDVILKDLFSFLGNTSDNNLNLKIDTSRGHVAIGGFSMGGDGALRLGLKNPNKFIAISAHGAAPSFAQQIAAGLAPLITNENRNSRDGNGNYNYNANNGFYTEAVMGISAAWNPNSSPGNIQFLLNPNGSLNSSAYEAMLPYADCQTIIKSKGLYKTATNNPFLYLEVGTADGFFGINNQFISELNSLGVDPKWFTYTTSPGKPHGFDIDRASEALKWIDEKLLPAGTTPISNLKVNSDYKLRPIYQAKKIEIILNTSTADGYINLLDINGRIIINKRVVKNQTEYYLDMTSTPHGVYIIHITSGNKIGSTKLVWNN